VTATVRVIPRPNGAVRVQSELERGSPNAESVAGSSARLGRRSASSGALWSLWSFPGRQLPPSPSPSLPLPASRMASRRPRPWRRL